MNSPTTTTDFVDDGLVRYESQTFDTTVDDEDSDDDDVHADQEVHNHVQYKVGRMLGAKADAVKEQLDVVKSDAPFVPQQLHESFFIGLPHEVQQWIVKKFKNNGFRYSVPCMTGKGSLAKNENNMPVLLEEMNKSFQLAAEKMPQFTENIRDSLTFLKNASKFNPNDDGNTVQPETYSQTIQGLVLLKDGLEKLLTYRNVQHAYYEFVKIRKLYEKTKTMNKIDAQKRYISELEEDIATWRGRKGESEDKEIKAILSAKIADAQKDIEGHKRKLVDLQSREKLRRSLRNQKTPRSASKSPRTVPTMDENGDLKRASSPMDEAGGDLKRRRSLSMVDAEEQEEQVVTEISDDENIDD